ncbi:hypothetical protein GQ457_13G017790 [Hibiscus cannabinus]
MAQPCSTTKVLEKGCVSPPPGKLYVFFTDGNSIPESDADFNHLISNGRELQALLPKLPPRQMWFPMEQVCASSCPSWPSKIPNHHLLKCWLFHRRQSFCQGLPFVGQKETYLSLETIYSKDLVEDVGGIWSVFVEQSSEPSTDTNTIPTHNLRITRSKIIANEDVDGVICHFIFHAECRERLRLPQGYFGNCLQPCVTAAKRNEQKMGL